MAGILTVVCQSGWAQVGAGAVGATVVPSTSVTGMGAGMGALAPAPTSTQPTTAPVSGRPGAVAPTPGVSTAAPRVRADAAAPVEASRAAEPSPSERAPDSTTASAARAEAEPATDFQRFVQLATGRLLPIYGQQFFSATRFDPVQATQVPEGYLLGPGDEFVIQAYGSFDFTERLVVGRDGRVTIPRVGPVQVAGLRFGDLEAALTRSLSVSYRQLQARGQHGASALH